MPTYERFKYCEHIKEDGSKCGRRAWYECECGGTHKDEDRGWAVKAKEYQDHPKFTCDTHIDLYEE